MSKNAPDFSLTFETIDDRLAEAEKRLKEKRQGNVKADKSAKESTQHEESAVQEKQTSVVSKQKTSIPKTPKTAKPLSLLKLVAKESRRNLTLKVLEENEREFKQLFYKLQIAGDVRKKQDLADEALQLLFAKYRLHI